MSQVYKRGKISRSALVLGQELGELKVLSPQVVRLLEHSLSSPEGGSMEEFSYTPGRYLGTHWR